MKFGPLPDKQKTIKCFEHRPGKFFHTADCPLARIMGGSSTYTCESIKEQEGVSRHFIITAKALRDARSKVAWCVESFQKITERKQAEKALEESNRKLEALSNTDGLTGIANRRRFDAVMAKEYARHPRSGEALSLILLDIDLFKSFNDYYGHVNGDKCLQQIALVMANYVTASQGVVTVKCSAGGSPVDIVTQVDTLLYLAKSSGRNRVGFIALRDGGEERTGNLV